MTGSPLHIVADPLEVGSLTEGSVQKIADIIYPPIHGEYPINRDHVSRQVEK